MKNLKLTFTLLAVLLFTVLFNGTVAATTTVNNLDGNNGLLIKMTANGDSYSGNVGYGTVQGIRVITTGGAKSYLIRRGSAATGNVLWTGYGNGFSAGTTNTIESRIPWRCPRDGFNIRTDDTTATSFTVELSVLP